MSDSEFDAVLIAKNARNATVHDLTGPLLQGTVQFERLNPRTMRVHAKESNFRRGGGQRYSHLTSQLDFHQKKGVD